MEKLTTMDMYELCNQYNWFTYGTTKQYERMFTFVNNACINSFSSRSVESIKKLSTIIWICSDDISEDEIFCIIYQFLADKLNSMGV